MSTAKQKLEYEVRLRDLASQALRNMGTNAEKQTSRAKKAFRKLAQTIKNVGLAVMAAFTAATFKGMLDGIRRTREFGKAMAEVSTIIGEGGMSIEHASERVNYLAMSLGVPAPEVAAGMYQTLSAGVTDSTEAMILLEGATKLGITGLASTKESVDLLTTAFNAYGMTVTDTAVESMSDLLFKTVQLGKTTIPELSASMGQVLPTAAQLGVSIEEVTAAVASLTLKGLSTSEAVTQVNAVMTAFLKKGDLAAKEFPELANLMGAAAIESKGFQGAITELMNAVDGNADALQKLMGRAEGTKAIMALTAEGGKVLTSQLEQMRDAAGVVESGFAMMSNTLDRKLAVAQEGIIQGFADVAKAIVDFQIGAETFDDVTEKAEAFKSAIQGLIPIMNTVGLVIGVIMTGIITVFAALQGAIYGVALGLNAMGLVADETLDGIEESTAGIMTALVGSAEMTENFGRALVGLESNGYEATAAMASLTNEFKDANSGLAQFNTAVARQNSAILDSMMAVKEGSKTEKEALAQIRRAYDYYTGKAEELNFELPKQVGIWEEILDRGSLFAKSMDEATDKVGELKGEVDDLGDSIGKTFSDEFTKRFSDTTTLMQHQHEIQIMLMEEGEEKQIAIMRHRAEMEERAMFDRLAALGLEQEEFMKLDRPWFEARRKLLEQEIEDFRAANKKKIDDARAAANEAAREQTRAWRQASPEIRQAILNPFLGVPAFAARVAAEAAVASEQAYRDGLKGKLGTDLAEQMGGGLAKISGFFELTPMFNLSNLKDQLVIAKEQVRTAFQEGYITQEQRAGMLDMIVNVEHFKMKELEAAAATYEFKRSLESLHPVQAGLKLGMKNFTDSIPELGEAMAELTEGAMNEFARGLASAMMAFADGSKSASEAFRQFAAEFIKQVGMMIVQMLILQGLKTAFGFGMADGGVAEGGTGSITPLAMGGVVNGGLGRALPVRGYANGGPIVSEPHVAVIGEGKMNEAIVPLPDGRSIPVDMKGGGETAISFSINAVDARGVDELLVERQDTIRNIIRQAMNENRVFRGTFRGA